MPRNAAGQYTLPVGNPVVTNTLIESDGWANPTMDDLGAEIEDSLSRDGKGSMRAALGIIDGSEANPGMRFIGETGSGIYRESDGRWWLVVKGVGKILVSELSGVIIDDMLTVEGDLIVNGTAGLVVAPVFIDGKADEVQLRVQGDAAQSENLLQWENSAGDIFGYVDADGRLVLTEQATPGAGTDLHFENVTNEGIIVKTGDENGGGDVVASIVINSISGNAYTAKFNVGSNTSADRAELNLLEQSGGGNQPAHQLVTDNTGDYSQMITHRLSGTQTENLHEWRDETGFLMAAIDKDGNFIAGPGPNPGGNTPDNVGNVPVGAIMHWPLDPPDLGIEWLICDGGSYATGSFPNLFAYLGYAYGGAAANFNVPDYRGNFLRGQDRGAGVDPQAGIRTNRGDGTTGDNPGTRQAEDVLATAIGAHTHLYQGVTGGPLSGGGGFAGGLTPTGPAAGGGTGVETRPVNVYTVIAIKAV